MMWLLNRLNDRWNRHKYKVDLDMWVRKKAWCENNNAAIRSRPTFRYDAFAQQELEDPGPAPDWSDYKGRSLGDNFWHFVLIAVVIIVAGGIYFFKFRDTP